MCTPQGKAGWVGLGGRSRGMSCHWDGGLCRHKPLASCGKLKVRWAEDGDGGQAGLRHLHMGCRSLSLQSATQDVAFDLLFDKNTDSRSPNEGQVPPTWASAGPRSVWPLRFWNRGLGMAWQGRQPKPRPGSPPGSA